MEGTEKGTKTRGRNTPQHLLCNKAKKNTTSQRDLLEENSEALREASPADLRRRRLVTTLHQTLAATGPAKHAGGGQHGEMRPGR